MFIQQCKATDLSKVNIDKLPTKGWMLSTKYDGNYVQIHKYGDEIKFFTSGEKEFYLPNTANELIKNNKGVNFVCEAEYVAHTEGLKGDRVHAAKLTTYRTEFEKGIASVDTLAYNKFKVFDLVYCSIKGEHDLESRLAFLKNIFRPSSNMEVVTNKLVTLDEARHLAREQCKRGIEGCVIKQQSHLYKEGKRVKDAIKLKSRPSVDLLCIRVLDGEGKYKGLIGSLLLQDSIGRTVAVGSGLSDHLRSLQPSYYIGKVIEIEYEQILNTYIQPVFIGIRDKKEID